MKKCLTISGLLFAILLAALLSAACASTGSGADSLSLREALEQSAERTAGELPRGSRVAIVAFESAHDGISHYIMEELTGALFDRGIEVADRRNLPYVFKELNFQMSGTVSDETAKSVGKFLAADMVITGDLIDLDSLYRYRTSVINVETAVRASVTRVDVRADRATRRMVATLARQQTVVTETKYGVSDDRTPQTAGTFLDRGIMYAMRREYDKAIADFTEAIRLNPDITAAYMLRALALSASVSRVIGVGENFSDLATVSTGERASAEQVLIYDRAIADHTEAIRLNPNHAGAYNNRGVAYAEKGDHDRAIADYTQAIRLNPDYADAYSNRGGAYSSNGDYDRAITDYTRAIRLNPNYAGAHYNRGNAYINKGDLDMAITDFTQAIRLNPNFAEAYSNRGVAYYHKGDYSLAVTDYTQAIRLDPNDAVAYNNRGHVHANNGDFDRAIADYTQAIRLDPNYAVAYNNRGHVHANNGDFDRAIADWEAVLRINPNHSGVRENIEIARRLRGY